MTMGWVLYADNVNDENLYMKNMHAKTKRSSINVHTKWRKEMRDDKWRSHAYECGENVATGLDFDTKVN